MLDTLIDGFETDAFCAFLRSKFPSFSESRRALKVEQTFLSAKGDADIPVCDSDTLHGQTRMSASPSGKTQTRMSASLCRMPDAPIAMSQRRLPHWQVDGAIYWVTFRLADSIPQEILRAWREERDIWLKQHPEPWDEQVWREHDERFTQRMEKWLDAGIGSRALARPDVRDAVKSCLMKFDGERLRVHAAVIMPTHVHCLIEPLDKVKQTFLSAISVHWMGRQECLPHLPGKRRQECLRHVPRSWICRRRCRLGLRRKDEG